MLCTGLRVTVLPGVWGGGEKSLDILYPYMAMIVVVYSKIRFWGVFSRLCGEQG